MSEASTSERSTHAHTRSGGVVLLARIAANTGPSASSTLRSASLGSARRGSIRLSASPRDSARRGQRVAAGCRARERKREHAREGAGEEERIDAERVNHHRLGERAGAEIRASRPEAGNEWSGIVSCALTNWSTGARGIDRNSVDRSDRNNCCQQFCSLHGSSICSRIRLLLAANRSTPRG